MDANFMYIGWVAFGVLLTVAIQLYFFRPKSFSEEYESKIESISIAFKGRLFDEIEELYKKKHQIESKPIAKKQIFPEVREDLVLYKLDDVLHYSSKYNEWSDALKDGKRYLKTLGISIFIFSIILLLTFHLLSITTDKTSLIFLIYIAIFPIIIAFMNAINYDKLTKQIDNSYSLVKKGDLKALMKKSS